MPVQVYNLATAATATGMTRAGVLKAIKRGAISASKDAAGSWCIEPAELHRVYQPTSQLTGGNRQDDPVNVELRAHLADAQAIIRDLQARLSESDRERTRLTMMLTDQRPTRRSWWRFGSR
jgi:hypothetical protein